MILYVRDGLLAADEVDVLSRLHAVAPVDSEDVAGVQIRPDGQLAVSVEALRLAAGAHAQDPAWQHDFEAMLSYAASRGWCDDAAAAVLVHVEDPRYGGA